MTLTLDDFGKALVKPPPNKSNPTEAKSIAQPSLCGEKSQTSLTQWASSGPHEFIGVPSTTPSLLPGVYANFYNNRGEISFRSITSNVDQLIDLPDSLHKKVLEEIRDFWLRGDKFESYGFLHRRGYLLYGPQGSGKTALVQQVISSIVKEEGIVFLCQRPESTIDGLRVFRQIEPTRRIVCIFEDIDAIIAEYGEDKILALLDGESQIDKVLNIATTNYPEKLDKRLVSRPRRFDRVVKIGMPSESIRRTFLKEKLKINGEELTGWVKDSEGLSFAALAELVISVKCLGNSYGNTIKILREMINNHPSSNEFDDRIGF